MSIKIMSQVWDDAEFKGTILLVLLALADMANDNGECWPSIGRLAQRARTDERRVYRCLTRLERTGWLGRSHRSGRSSVYRVTPKLPPTPGPGTSPVNKTPLAQGPRVEALTPGPGTTPPLVQGPPTPGPGTTQNHKEPSNEPVVEVVVREPSPAREAENTTTPPPPEPERDVTLSGPPAFPRFAQAQLSNVTPEQAADWRRAWGVVCEQAQAWEPALHLTHYLARKREQDKPPTATEWVRWFVTDEAKARTEAAEARAAHAAETKPTNPYWE